MLHRVETLAEHVLISRKLERATAGVMLIDVTTDRARRPPIHWRAGDWTKPPLDIEIDPVDGSFQAVQLVLQDERVSAGSLEPVAYGEGIPVLDIADWSGDRFKDVRWDVRHRRVESGEMVVSIGKTVPNQRSGWPGLSFGWDEDDNLCELIIGPLSAHEWHEIALCEPVASRRRASESRQNSGFSQ